MPILTKPKQPSLFWNVLWGGCLGTISIIILMYVLWTYRLIHGQQTETAMYRQFTLVLDALDKRKFYSALFQLWFLGKMMCPAEMMVIAMVIGGVVGYYLYKRQKHEQQKALMRELQQQRRRAQQPPKTKKSIFIIISTVIVGILVFLFRKLRR